MAKRNESSANPSCTPTDQLKKVVNFYCEGLGLKKIGSFEGHEGYDGIMIGLPNSSYHLEFTQHKDGSPCPAPTRIICLSSIFLKVKPLKKSQID